MSSISKRRKDGTRAKIKSTGDHEEFLKRIERSLYYGLLPSLPCLSLPVTEISCELWSLSQRGRSLRRLHPDEASDIARSACVSPCALVLAILYLERLHTCNPDYVADIPPAHLFLVSLMVSNKFLQDDGEDDEVICSEWAASGGIDLETLKQLEIQFLSAIDWNVFVSDDAFESGLNWLERQVAVKQARLRGFFTYADLTATCDNKLLQDILKSISTACLALSLTYITSLMTIVTSTLVITQALIPNMQSQLTNNSNPLSVDSALPQEMALVFGNRTLQHSEPELPSSVKCCSDWTKFEETLEVQKNWYQGSVVNTEDAFVPWWSKTSVLNWLYQSSLIIPSNRWLEKLTGFRNLFKNQLMFSNSKTNTCKDYSWVTRGRDCKQWMNFSKIGAMIIAVSDR